MKHPSRAYDASDDLSFTVSGLTDGDTTGQVLNGNLSRASGSDVGAYAISFGTLAVTSAFTRKYVLPEASTLGSYTITPKEVTVDSAVLTKEYDGAPGLSGAQLIGGEVSGAVSEQSLTLSVTGGSYATVNVATGINDQQSHIRAGGGQEYEPGQLRAAEQHRSDRHDHEEGDDIQRHGREPGLRRDGHGQHRDQRDLHAGK